MSAAGRRGGQPDDADRGRPCYRGKNRRTPGRAPSLYTAREQGRRAALVEQHRPNMFPNEVANIPPGGGSR